MLLPGHKVVKKYQMPSAKIQRCTSNLWSQVSPLNTWNTASALISLAAKHCSQKFPIYFTFHLLNFSYFSADIRLSKWDFWQKVGTTIGKKHTVYFPDIEPYNHTPAGGMQFIICDLVLHTKIQCLV